MCVDYDCGACPELQAERQGRRVRRMRYVVIFLASFYKLAEVATKAVRASLGVLVGEALFQGVQLWSWAKQRRLRTDIEIVSVDREHEPLAIEAVSGSTVTKLIFDAHLDSREPTAQEIACGQEIIDLGILDED